MVKNISRPPRLKPLVGFTIVALKEGYECKIAGCKQVFTTEAGAQRHWQTHLEADPGSQLRVGDVIYKNDGKLIGVVASAPRVNKRGNQERSVVVLGLRFRSAQWRNYSHAILAGWTHAGENINIFQQGTVPELAVQVLDIHRPVPITLSGDYFVLKSETFWGVQNTDYFLSEAALTQAPPHKYKVGYQFWGRRPYRRESMQVLKVVGRPNVVTSEGIPCYEVASSGARLEEYVLMSETEIDKYPRHRDGKR